MTNPPTLITGNAELAAAAARFAAGPRLAVDTEFFRERTYIAELALIQLGIDGQVALIDPLAGLDLAPVVAMLNAPSLTKVLHAGRQDLEVLLPLTGAPATPLIDTQIAAALLGMPAQIGYADLVARELGHTLEKSQTRTDWTRRPLSRAQLEYAADDVRWLLPLAQRLEERLAARGRLEWLREDCAALSSAALYGVNPADAWQRLKGIETLAPREQVRLRTLAAWREREAARRNLPRSWLLADDALRALARAAPREAAALKALGVIPASTADKIGADIVAELERAGAAPLDGVVQRADSRPGPDERARGRRLTDRLSAVARELEVAPEVLATQRDLKRIARGEAPATVLRGWRSALLAAPFAADLASA